MLDLASQFFLSLKDPSAAAAITAIATALAAVASLCAVGISIYALAVQKRHDKKAIRPIPQIILGDYEDHIWVAIENVGIGPFTINKFEVTSSDGRTKKSVIEFMPDISFYFLWDDFIEQIEGRTIPPQGKLEILSFRGQSVFGVLPNGIDNRSGTYESVRAALGSLTITLEGTDIYSESLPPCTRKLDWFFREKVSIKDKLLAHFASVDTGDFAASVEDNT